MRRPLAALVLLASLTLAPRALADDAAEKKHALELFERSEQAYKDGRFQESVDLLLESRRNYHAPVLLYDLGRAYEALGKPAEAADAYEGYLREDDKAPDRKAIEGRIATLRAQAAELAKPKEQPKPPPVVVVKVTEKEKPSPVVPLAIAGVGLGVLVTGVVLGFAAKSAHTDANNEPVQTKARDDQDRAKSLATAATVLDIAGGVLAAVGIGWTTYVFVSSSSSSTGVVAGAHGVF